MEKLRPKLFHVLRHYSKEQLVKDVVAGIIVAIIALPLSIALALASGVGPEQGIYTGYDGATCCHCSSVSPHIRHSGTG